MVDAVQHQIGQSNGIDRVILFATVKGILLERFNLAWQQIGAMHMFIGLGQKATGATAGS
ncbi:MAG: hypothetical protein R2867_47295 [Caldilineaceae bacterium]